MKIIKKKLSLFLSLLFLITSTFTIFSHTGIGSEKYQHMLFYSSLGIGTGLLGTLFGGVSILGIAETNRNGNDILRDLRQEGITIEPGQEDMAIILERITTILATGLLGVLSMASFAATWWLFKNVRTE